MPRTSRSSGRPQCCRASDPPQPAHPRTIKQNLGWAFGYILAALALAAVGLLNPVVALAPMAFSSLSVVGNALRLRRFIG